MLLLPLSVRAEEYRHGIASLSQLKYPPDFAHFEYANPNAPKGGAMRLAMPGTFDSFNIVVQKGRPAAGMHFIGEFGPMMLLYDRLLEPAADEATSAYGRLAEAVELAPDMSFVTFRLRPNARWHDGVPITVDDLIFSLDAYKSHGSGLIKTMLRDVSSVERAGEREVRYVLTKNAVRSPSVALTIGSLAVLPKHYWDRPENDVTFTTGTPPLGSGPYRIRDFELGRYVRYGRVADYWGRDLPVNRGRYNFDIVKFDYFRDDHAMLEANKANLIDLRPETVSKQWATEYDFAAVRAGLFKKELLSLKRTAGLYLPVFWNLRVERLRDARVREALWLLYDFEWTNRVLLHGFYEHGKSLFHGSEMAHSGTPSAEELELLEPFRDQLPPRVFGPAFEPPAGEGSKYRRARMERAIALFREAGLEIRDRRLAHGARGEQFRIEFVVASPTLQRTLLPYVDVLRKIGIDASVRMLEISNWQYRMRNGIFDAGMLFYSPSERPGAELRARFSSMSAGISFSLNWGAIRNPVLDHLIDKALGARTYPELRAAIRAFDRVFLWNFYLVPGMANPAYRRVYWDKFGQPQHPPLSRSTALDTWWWDERKSARVERGLSRLEQEN